MSSTPASPVPSAAQVLPNPEELLRICAEAVKENDRLRAALNFAVQTVDEISFQRKTVQSLLDTANVKLATLATKPATLRCEAKVGNWYKDCWLACGGVLAQIEEYYQRGLYQKALIDLDKILRSDFSTDILTLINAKLLKAKTLSQCDQFETSFHLIDEAIDIATTAGLSDARSKAYFHRGIILFHTENYPAASLSFASATGTKYHKEEVQAWMESTESKLAMLNSKQH